MPLKTLKNSTVLAVDRKDLNAFLGRFAGYNLTGHDQGFFIGQGDRLAGFDSCQGRHQTGRTDYRCNDDIYAVGCRRRPVAFIFAKDLNTCPGRKLLF